MNQILKSLILVLALTVSQVQGQEEAAEPESAASATDSLSEIFGEGGMELSADGMFIMESNPETGDPKTIRVQKNVNILSEVMNLKCENLEINYETQVMLARGGPVEFERDDIAGVSERLTYDIETKKIVLEGTSRPLIRQKDKNGRITETKADRITIVQNEKSNDLQLEGKPEIKVLPAPKVASANGGRTEASKINTKEDLSKIPAPSPRKPAVDR